MAKYVRVKLPKRSPANTLTLAKEVASKHMAVGGASPLYGFVDMVGFSNRVQQANLLQENGDQETRLSQSFYSQMVKRCGISSGQTRRDEGTVMWFVTQIRDVLRIKYRGTEKDMGLFGFHVVVSQTAARRNVRVPIPVSRPEKLLELASAIIEKHNELGMLFSPLSGEVDMTGFSALVSQCVLLMNQWRQSRGLKQSLHAQALKLIGYAEGQTASTDGTLYYDLVSIRERLLQKFEGEEDIMQEWGFQVVVHEKKNGRKRKQLAVDG